VIGRGALEGGRNRQEGMCSTMGLIHLWPPEPWQNSRVIHTSPETGSGSACQIRRSNLGVSPRGADALPPLTVLRHQASPDCSELQPVIASTLRFNYTVLIGPGYWDAKESVVRSVTPSTVACATKILSKGSL
jgi:hypothetical protein